MGVPRLAPWIFARFKNAIRRIQQGRDYRALKVDNFYLDANGLLHPSAQRVWNYGTNKKRLDDYAHLTPEKRRVKTYEVFFNSIKDLTRIIVPDKLLYIAIDGPAPLAKQAQQRQRRFVAMMDQVLGTKPEFSSNEMTPGTLFMFEMTKYLHLAIRKEMQPGGLWHNIEVIFSPPTVCGEGEHKCLQYIRDNPNAQTESHCIYGLDGDLIMLTLSAHVPNMFLFREDQYTPGFYDLLDMGLIRKDLAGAIGESEGVKRKIRTLDDITDDFVLLGFFVGNDFLPKLQMFLYLEDGLELMIATYAKMSSSGTKNLLTGNRKIDHASFTRFIEELARREQIYILDQNSKILPDPRFKNVTLATYVKVDPKTNVSKLDFAGYRVAYYKKAGIDASDERSGGVDKMCKDYIRTIAWVFEYYVSGLPSWTHFYPWHYPPLMTDLAAVMGNLSAGDLKGLYTFKLGEPSLPFVQLLSVLPPTSADLLPVPLRGLFKHPTLVKAGFYPKTFQIDLEGKTKEHMGVALLPFVDVDVVKKVYAGAASKMNGRYARNENTRAEKFWYDSTIVGTTYTSDYGVIKGNLVRKMFL